LLLKQLELVVRASNAACAELYVNEKYSDLWRLDGGSKTEVIYESIDGGWSERLHDGSHVVYRCHGAAAKDHYDASDNYRYDNNVTTLSFPLMSIYGKKDAVYYGRLLVYVQKSEHGARRDNDGSRASLSMLLQSFAESMSMIVSMSCNTAIDEMVVANRLTDLRDDTLSIQYNTRSALQTISTYVRLLQRRMRDNDEIGLELLDNVLVQVHSIDVNVNALGDSIDTGGGVHRKALSSNTMSRQVVFAAGDDPINSDDSAEYSGHGDDDGGPLQSTENSLAQDDQCVDGSSVITLNNSSSSSSSSYNAESSIIESTIVWTTTKHEIEVDLMMDGDRGSDDDGDRESDDDGDGCNDDDT